jgi:hypothetical protein
MASERTNDVRRILMRMVSSTGQQDGSYAVTGDYSDGGLGSTIFKIAPLDGEVYVISRLLGYYEDVGAFDTDKYGNNITLTNGITMEYDWRNEVIQLIADGPIKTNGNWAATCYDVVQQAFGLGNEYLSFRWTFQKTCEVIRLDGSKGEELRMIFHDDFSDLEVHQFQIQGFQA